MPKENIYCAANRDNEDVRKSWRAEVQWNGGPSEGDGFVMLGTVNPDSPYRYTMVHKDGADEPFEGWFVTLDRAGLNRMIRALRRARDTAYGADA